MEADSSQPKKGTQQWTDPPLKQGMFVSPLGPRARTPKRRANKREPWNIEHQFRFGIHCNFISRLYRLAWGWPQENDMLATEGMTADMATVRFVRQTSPGKYLEKQCPGHWPLSIWRCIHPASWVSCKATLVASYSWWRTSWSTRTMRQMDPFVAPNGTCLIMFIQDQDSCRFRFFSFGCRVPSVGPHLDSILSTVTRCPVPPGCTGWLEAELGRLEGETAKTFWHQWGCLQPILHGELGGIIRAKTGQDP